jgi:RHS repeat-associated protein
MVIYSDPVGNRLSNLTSSGWSYNTSNELNSRPGDSYTFDHNGNTIVKTDSTGNTSYTWDYENRMTSVILPGSGGTVTFLYDPFGRRIYKSSSSGTSIYAYDGDNLVEEVNSSGTAVARYAQGLNIDEPLVMLRGGATSYYQADGLGSVTSLTNAAGTAAQTYTYDSFGNTVATSGSLVNSFQYTGREFDPETSLYYYRARYYDPHAGRFISEDPIGFEGGHDFYAYVGNDPDTWIDPFGFAPAWPWLCRFVNCFPAMIPSTTPVPTSSGSLSYDKIAALAAANNRSGQSNELIICLVYKESSFNPYAIQKLPNTARGLMGVTTGAAQDMGADYSKLADPALNISVGSGYLRRRINSKEPFGAAGDVEEGLGKYGEGTPYADSILDCEKCLLQESQKSSACKTKDCLVPLHGKKQ